MGLYCSEQRLLAILCTSRRTCVGRRNHEASKFKCFMPSETVLVCACDCDPYTVGPQGYRQRRWTCCQPSRSPELTTSTTDGGKGTISFLSHSSASLQLTSRPQTLERALRVSPKARSFSVLVFIAAVCRFEVGGYYATGSVVNPFEKLLPIRWYRVQQLGLHCDRWSHSQRVRSFVDYSATVTTAVRSKTKENICKHILSSGPAEGNLFSTCPWSSH